jgi:hydroxysqualene dehydroxylase
LKRVVIIGGGFAGLAAAVRLSERGLKVLLLERRGFLGGRAYSFIDTKTGDTVDNGQHLFMGCYRHTIAFLKKIGSLDRLKFQSTPRVDFLDKKTGYATFKCPPLPAPMHVLAGLLKMRGLSFGDKIRAIKVSRAIQSNGNSAMKAASVSEWLDELKQSDRIKRRFWYPIATATLNENPEVASARMMKAVLKEAFGADRKSSNIGMARVGLSDLYTTGASEFIQSHGGEVRTGAQATRFVIEQGRIAAIELRGGEIVEGDYFISAVPHTAFLQLIPEEYKSGEFASLTRLDSSPIISINLWFDRPIIDREFVGLLGTRSQWVFNKDLIFSASKRTNQVAVVISAAHDLVELTKEQLVEVVLSELNELIPESRSARLFHSVVVKEREATLSHTIGSDRLRPGPRTTISNLFLAGDWIDTGLPATIESAVLSGNIAADCVEVSHLAG